MIKQFSRVRLVDGAEGDVMDVYTDPEGYDIDISDPAPGVPLPKNWIRLVTPDQIEEVLREPKD